MSSLRENALSQVNTYRTETFEWNGKVYEVRQLGVGERGELMRKVSLKGRTEEEMMQHIDATEMQIWSVIYCVFDPETGERVFEEDDYEALLAMPSGGFVDLAAKVAGNLMNVKPEEDAKNSDGGQEEEI